MACHKFYPVLKNHEIRPYFSDLKYFEDATSILEKSILFNVSVIKQVNTFLKKALSENKNGLHKSCWRKRVVLTKHAKMRTQFQIH